MSDEIDRAPITTEEYAFIEEFRGQFKRAIEHVIGNPVKDQFDEVLSAWAIHLGVLAYGALGTVISLLKTGDIRGAYMMQRPLLDYHLRLRYYTVQVEEVRAKLNTKKNKKRHKNNHLKQCLAYVDWHNAEDKVYDIIKRRGPNIKGLDQLSDDQRKLVVSKLEKEHKILTRRTWEMCKAVADETFGSLYIEHQVLSAHIHGDQLAIIDTMGAGELAEGNLEVNWDTKWLNAYPILCNSFLWCYELMATIEMFKGWCYAKVRAYEHAYRRLLRRKPEA